MKCKDKYESERFVLSHTTDAVLMGGYLRDLLLDRPWKDIDLFYSMAPSDVKTYSTGRVFHLQWAKDERNVVTKWKAISSVGYEGGFVVLHCADLPGVQLILFCRGYNRLSKQHDRCVGYMLSHFPCNLSKAALKLEDPPHLREPYYSSSFEFGVREGVLEFSAGCPQEYRDRMASYFPDFTIIELRPPYF